MFHSFAIAIVIGLIAALGLAVFSGFIFNLALYTAVSLLTIGIASASYHAYETPFLRLKNRFRRIKLGKKAI
jgi:peptidoglycan/LPS O-acetylase OafA/YrhL